MSGTWFKQPDVVLSFVLLSTAHFVPALFCNTSDCVNTTLHLRVLHSDKEKKNLTLQSDDVLFYVESLIITAILFHVSLFNFGWVYLHADVIYGGGVGYLLGAD